MTETHRLYIIRHAIAEDREEFKKTGLPDDERPLTDRGIAKMRKISKKLSGLLDTPLVIFQSPLTRSQQTVTILSKDFPEAEIHTLRYLRPGSSFDALIEKLNSFNNKNIAIVGHEDHLSKLTNYLLTGERSVPALSYKKGGVASLTYSHKIVPGKLRLEWLATPKVITE